MNDLLNRPISPILINKCIGVVLLPVAMYSAWTAAKTLAGFDIASFVSELIFAVLPSACLVTVAVFCVVFALKAFRSEPIKRAAIVMAFLQIICIAFIAALEALLGGDIAITGDAAMAFAFISLWAFVVFYLPAVIAAAMFAVTGIRSLTRSVKVDGVSNR